MIEETFPNSIIKLIGNKLLSILDIISENGNLPSVEDTETSMIRLKIESMLVPGEESFNWFFLFVNLYYMKLIKNLIL